MTAPTDRTPVEHTAYAEFIKRSLRAFGRRAGDDVDALTLLRDIGDEYNRVLDDAARKCHETWSWGEIALRLGVTRQAAQKRWGGGMDDEEAMEATDRCDRCGDPMEHEPDIHPDVCADCERALDGLQSAIWSGALPRPEEAVAELRKHGWAVEDGDGGNQPSTRGAQ